MPAYQNPTPSDSAYVKAVIALGANLGDRESNIAQALQLLDANQQIRVSAQSTLIETPPMGQMPQPAYLNGAAVIETRLKAKELLAFLQHIELESGRPPQHERQYWGPRVLDLDLIFYGNEIIDSPTLTVPHTHMHERDFVLGPLMEIAPNWRHPIFKQSVRELMLALQSGGEPHEQARSA